MALVDTDVIAHALTAIGGRAIDAIRKALGTEFIAPDGSLDRVATRDRVFADVNAKTKLEAILHPLIREEVEHALCVDAVQRAPYAMLVVPLLFESLAYRSRVHVTLLVDCTVSCQLQRVKIRSNIGLEQAGQIVSAQLPRALRLQLTDDLIWNGKSGDALGTQIETLHLKYLGNAARL